MSVIAAQECVAQAASALFVPGNRPERFVKAFLSGADVVIIDLEDAVPADEKSTALDAVVAALTTSHSEISDGRLHALVRINSGNHSVELAALRDVSAVSGNGLLGVMIPKAETTQDIHDVAAALPRGMAVVPLIESARGLVNVEELASAENVTRLAFGAVDFGVDVDATDPSVFDYARARIVIASVAHGIPAPLDSPCLSISDDSVVLAEASHARAVGCGGKLSIHPSQIPHIHQGFYPTADDIRWATEVLEHEGSAVQVDGMMVDKPVVDRARKILSRTHKDRA
jgi:citrate lyase beta subunit